MARTTPGGVVAARYAADAPGAGLRGGEWRMNMDVNCLELNEVERGALVSVEISCKATVYAGVDSLAL